MDIYQGGPLSAILKVKETNQQGQEVYVSDLSGYTMEALLRKKFGEVVAKWSTAAGTITSGQITESGATVGYLAFFLSGSHTALLVPGAYTIELAKVLNSNGQNVTAEVSRAIGSAYDSINIKYAAIKEGVTE